MSYCRSVEDESDVYVIGTSESFECFGAGWTIETANPVHELFDAADYDIVDGEIVQLSTTHKYPRSFFTTSRQALIDHLLEHRAAGHLVPDYALDRLRKEIQAEGDEYQPHR